jgi:N-acetylglucosaminyldiphosphoundecaprenol N-acetyl-beta-D-mannosaminyltransferase
MVDSAQHPTLWSQNENLDRGVPSIEGCGYVEAVPDSVTIMGIDFDPIGRDEVEAEIIKSIDSGRGGRVVTANVDILRRSHSDPTNGALVRSADLVVADGTPIVWAARLAGRPLSERVAGSDLIWSLSQRAADHGHSIYLLGGAPGCAERAAEILAARYPRLRMAGWSCPPLGFEHSAAEMDQIKNDLIEAKPDIVFAGLGFPKQDQAAEQLRVGSPRAWFIGVGVSIDLVAGKVRRAPTWTHRLGLEWCYRLTQEPRKLARRYLIDGIPFAGTLFGWALVTRFTG